MQEYEAVRLTTIFRIVNLFSAKEISDLLMNIGVDERYPHHERTTARDRLVEVLDGNLENLIRNLDYPHINKILDITQLPNSRNRNLNQQEILAYFNAKSKDIPNDEKLIGTYTDHEFMEYLTYEFSSMSRFLNKNDLEILADLLEVLLFLGERNPEDIYQVDTYSIYSGEYHGYRIKVNPEYFSIHAVFKDNPVVAAINGSKYEELSSLLYFVNKEGIVKGKTDSLISHSKMEIYKTVLL